MIHLQPSLENSLSYLIPLQEKDFEDLYKVASDSKIWEQHPNKDRWKREVFKNYFAGAIKSKGAFKIIEKKSGDIIGCTRFYDFNEVEKNILIGYTFYGVAYWGKGFNQMVKAAMLDYIFQFVNKVIFHIGAQNIRSQKAITKIGAEKTGEEEVTYYGEQPKLNFVYEIIKENWLSK